MTPNDEGKRKAAGWKAREWTPAGERLLLGARGGGSVTGPMTADESQSMERELLLADGPADPREAPRPAPRRRAGWLALTAVLLVASSLLAAAFLRERRAWEDNKRGLEEELARISRQSAQEVEALKAEGSRKDQQITERKSENLGLAALLQKTMEQLQASLADLRAERTRNEKLEASAREAVAAVRKETASVLAEWIPRWARAVESAARVAPAVPPAAQAPPPAETSPPTPAAVGSEPGNR